jgi:hypothetical protein
MNFIKLYANGLPFISIFSTVMAIDIGRTVARRNPDDDTYSNIIGYTSLGIITGVTYPISYPLFGSYLLYKNYFSK